MTVDRSNLDLSRFRFPHPARAWWDGFTRGRRAERERAIGQCADWQPGDWERGKAAEILEGEAT